MNFNLLLEQVLRETHYLTGPVLSYLTGPVLSSLVTLPNTLRYSALYIYMKIHVPSMLAKGVKTINKQAATMA